MTPAVSVVIACFNEAPTIASIVRGCLAHTPGLLEVLVVDDGSRDDSARLAQEAGARVIALPRNQGKGAALRRGIDEARGDVLVFLDADGQDDPSEIPLLLDALNPGVDLVIGSRFMGRFERGAITPVNRVGNRFLTGVANVLFASRVTDTQAGFRAVRRAALSRVSLRARSYEIETDVLLQILRAGGVVREVPVTRLAREHGSSGLHAVRDGLRILATIVRIRAGL